MEGGGLMTISEADSICRAFYRKNNPTEDEEFVFTEALLFLIKETNDPEYMMDLGGWYYGKRNFVLALKYYEMAALLRYPPANECLGYVWYYGRTGVKDYEKAFKYFKAGMDDGNLVAAYKIADMYKNGYYVEKDYEKYKEIIEDLFPKVRGLKRTNDPVPEVYTRLARIRSEEGKTDEAISLYLYAKDFLAQRIRYNPFWGNINIMLWLVDDLYKLVDIDAASFDFYDMYFLLKRPVKIRFKRGRKVYEVEAVEEDGEIHIRFGDKWFRNRDEFYKKAEIGTSLATDIYDELSGFEVV